MDFRFPLVIVLIPVVMGIIFLLRRGQKPSGFRFPTLQLFNGLPSSWKVQFQHTPYVLRLLAIVLFLVALSGPRSVLQKTLRKTEGIDIVLAVDASGSMAAEDFKIRGKRVNRLDIVKNVVSEFIGKRENDRIGLIAFAGVAYTVCPLTTDYSWLQTNLDRIELGLIKDGTAIGSAIGSSLTRLRNSDAKSKVVILLTDGVNNAGKMSPTEAAQAAQALGIKIYTIGAGTQGFAPYPMTDFFGRKMYQNVRTDIDEAMLKEVADTTGGQYFRATDTASLRKIYAYIDEMEKTKIEEIGFQEYKELFTKPLLLALLLLILEVILSNTVFLKIP